MAINVMHAPSAQLLGQVATAAGAGMFNQRQADRQERRNQLLLGAALSDRAQRMDFAMDQARLGAQLQAQQQSQLMDMYLTNARAQQQFALAQAQAQQDNQLAQQRMAMNFAGSLIQNQSELDLRRELGLLNAEQEGQQAQARLAQEQGQWDARQNFLWQADAVETAEAQVNELQAEMSKAQSRMTPEGRRIYADLAGKLRAIQKQRGTQRPQQYANLLAQWQEEFDRSGVRDHIEEIPTVDQTWQENAFPLPTGGFAVREPDGKGGWTWKEIGKQTGLGAKNARPVDSYETYYADPADYSKEYDAIYKSMLDAAEKTGKLPTDIGVDREMRRRFNRWRQAAGLPPQELPALAPPPEFVQQIDAQLRRSNNGMLMLQKYPDLYPALLQRESQRQWADQHGESYEEPQQPNPGQPAQKSAAWNIGSSLAQVFGGNTALIAHDNDIQQSLKTNMPPDEFARVYIQNNGQRGAMQWLAQKYPGGERALLQAGNPNDIALFEALKRSK